MDGAGIWSTVLKSLDELVEVRDLAGVVDTTALVVEARGERRGLPLSADSCSRGRLRG